MSWIHNKKNNQFRTLNAGVPTMRHVYELIKGVTSNSKFYELELAEVVDILLTEDDLPTLPDGSLDYSLIGAIKARMIHSQQNIPISELQYIKPLDSNIKIYPLIGEYVIVSEYLGILYYSTPVNILNSINHNLIPGISDLNTESQLSNVEFQPNPNIRQIQLGEGEILYAGRYGQGIKFGKNTETLSPNIKLFAKIFTDDTTSESPFIEDINTDDSSIWILTDELVEFEPSYESNQTFDFSGKEIFISSDKIVFNSRENELLGFSKKQIYFGSPNITLDTNELKTIIGSKDEHLVLGETLIELLTELVDTLVKNQIATGGGPAVFNTGTTFNPAFVSQFKQKLKDILTVT